MKKRGPWSKSEIEECHKYLQMNWDEERIAKHLDRNVVSVKDKIDQFNMVKPNTNAEKAVRITLRGTLHKKAYWVEILKQFTKNEINYFEGSWIDLMIQFQENVLPTEEMQLKQFIIIDILINRSLKERNVHEQDIENTQIAINVEYAKDIDVRDTVLLGSLEQQLSCARGAVTAYTVEYRTLLDKQSSISKDLKATREKRIKNIEDSKTSWAGMIRALEEDDLRKRMGDEAEIYKIAGEKAKNELAEYHTYADGSIDQPFLSSDTIKDDEVVERVSLSDVKTEDLSIN